MSTTEITAVATKDDMERVLAIRRRVFMDEQGVSEAEEMDGLDCLCRHYLLHFDGQPVGTVRVRPLQDDEAKVERMAVLPDHRKQGLGALLLNRILDDYGAAGYRRVVLNAQTHAEPFYGRFGFVGEGEIFMEAGIPHIRMVRDL
jgi:predicted GNAT family N-acyltransferase